MTWGSGRWFPCDELPPSRVRVSGLQRVESAGVDHLFTDAPRLPQRFLAPDILALRELLDEAVERLVEGVTDELLGVRHVLPLPVHDRDLAAVPHALRDHQPVDAVGREVLHVAVEEARPLAVEHPVPVADHGADRGARSVHGAGSHTRRRGPQVWVALDRGGPRLDLVGRGELGHRDRVLVGMTGPGAVHEAARLVALVLLEYREGASVELRVLAAGTRPAPYSGSSSRASRALALPPGTRHATTLHPPPTRTSGCRWRAGGGAARARPGGRSSPGRTARQR